MRVTAFEQLSPPDVLLPNTDNGTLNIFLLKCSTSGKKVRNCIMSYGPSIFATSNTDLEKEQIVLLRIINSNSLCC